jgi:multiple sugar transport system permease protein
VSESEPSGIALAPVGASVAPAGTATDGPAPVNAPVKRSRLRRRSARLGYFLCSPAFAVILLVTVGPVVLAALMSFTHVNLVPGGMTFTWAGLANYKTALSSDLVRGALAFTFEFAIASVVLGLVLGTLIAIVLDEMSHGRVFVLTCLLIPYSIIGVISGQLWSYILNGVYGIANYILVSFHIISQPITFLNSPQAAFWSIMVADSWKSMPFVTLIVLAGLRMIDRDLYAAAQVDGAGWYARVTKITLPLLKPAILTAAVFRVLQCFGVFDIIYILTMGGPGTSTQSIAMLMYNTLFESFNLSLGSAMSTITTVIVLVIAIAVLRVFRLQVQTVGRG